MYTLSINTGASRVCSGGNISHPCGFPTASPEQDHEFMRKTVETAVNMLEEQIKDQKLIVIGR